MIGASACDCPPRLPLRRSRITAGDAFVSFGFDSVGAGFVGGRSIRIGSLFDSWRVGELVPRLEYFVVPRRVQESGDILLFCRVLSRQPGLRGGGRSLHEIHAFVCVECLVFLREVLGPELGSWGPPLQIDRKSTRLNS